MGREEMNRSYFAAYIAGSHLTGLDNVLESVNNKINMRGMYRRNHMRSYQWAMGRKYDTEALCCLFVSPLLCQRKSSA
jgi:hypothetical protein